MPIDDFLAVSQPPPVSGADLGVPDLPAAPQMPLAPQPKSGLLQMIRQALPGVLGGAMGPGAGTGLLQGYTQASHQREERERQLYQDAVREYQLQQQAYTQRAQQHDIAIRQREQVLQQNLQHLRAAVEKAPDKKAYDALVEAYANGLRMMGFTERVDANFLRKSVPYAAPSSEKQAWDVLQRWQSLPNNKKLLEDHPEQAANAMIPFDRDGDGQPEMVRLQDLSVLAGAPLAMTEDGQVFSNPGTPLSVKANADGILQQLLAKAKAEGKQITPELTVSLQQEAIKLAAEAKPDTGGGLGSAGTNEDAEAIADAIARGEQPPTLQGLYGAGRKVRAALARQGFNLADAQTDWNATQAHLRTLNGAQQTRMRQAVDNAYHSLDVIEELAREWKGGRFPTINKGRLAAAKQGVLGPQAQQIATKLEAQISDVTSELGNVYMGGNSPTDHALGLAAKNLSADWTEAQLVGAINLARKNLQIRSNSMKNVGVAGIDNSQYTPSAPSPSAGGGEEWVRDPATGRLRKR